MKRCTLLISIYLIFIQVNSQILPEDSIVLNNPNSIIDIKVDWFNQLYLLTTNQNIWKLDNNQEWSNHRSQLPIKNLNVDNPFRVFYVDAISSLHILDNSLIEIEEALPLYAIGTINPKILVRQSKNRLWTLDILKEQLILYDLNLKQVIHTSDRLNTFPEEEWLKAIESGGELFLFSNQRMIKFNAMGKIIKTMDIPESTNIQLFNTNLYYTVDQKLYLKNYIDASECIFEFSHTVENFSISTTKIYVLSDGVVYIYPTNPLELNPCTLQSPETLAPVKQP